MKKIAQGLMILCVLWAVAGPAWALAPAGRGMGYFSLGLSRVDRGDLQARLDRTGLGYPLQPRDYLALGGGGLFCGRRLVIGGEGLALISSDRVGGGIRTSLTGGFGVFQVGYALVNTENWTIYPLLGFGGGAFTWIIQREEIPDSFEDVIWNPETGSSLLNASFLLQAALGVNHWIRLHSSDRGSSCLVVGLRIGYSYSPFGDNWEIEMHDQALELSGAPELGMTGPFVRLVIGWGGVGRNRM
ncbi:MAG: hypothetical protein MUP19_10480 [Candidatus Aminicenantes bacterium]|nr:hypothetical protein [Candidatus Aminicenantes bacterium]